MRPVARGSRPCATRDAEPRQARKGATVRRPPRVPRVSRDSRGAGLRPTFSPCPTSSSPANGGPGPSTEVVGQGTVTRTLQNALGSGRIGHAFLLSGARGVGKTTTARILARALNCSAGEGPTRRALRRVRVLRGDRGGQLARRAGDRRRHPQRRRAGARAARERALQPGARPLQGVDHRRGPHALHRRLQRAAEDARGAAAAGQVHLRHHRVPQAARHHPLALPAVRLPHDLGARDPGAPAHGGGRRGHQGVGRRARAASRARPRAAPATRSRCSTRCCRSAAQEVRDEDISVLLGLIDRELLLAASRAAAARRQPGAAGAGRAALRVRRRLPELQPRAAAALPRDPAAQAGAGRERAAGARSSPRSASGCARSPRRSRKRTCCASSTC